MLCDKCRPEISKKGEFIDLKSRERFYYDNSKCVNNMVIFKTFMIPLGVAMELPKGFEAVIIPRSSTFKYFGIIESNSMGLIDNCYNGNQDEWKLPAVALRSGNIEVGDRVCQFKIQLSQKATFIQKLNWLFSSGVELEFVDTLNNINRGGFGSTGKA